MEIAHIDLVYGNGTYRQLYMEMQHIVEMAHIVLYIIYYLQIYREIRPGIALCNDVKKSSIK